MAILFYQYWSETNGKNGGYGHNKPVPGGASVYDGYGKGNDGHATKRTGTGGLAKGTFVLTLK